MQDSLRIPYICLRFLTYACLSGCEHIPDMIHWFAHMSGTGVEPYEMKVCIYELH